MTGDTILIVDDEDFICENLQRIIREEGYESIVAKTGSEAIATVKSSSVDLVLLDLKLSDIPGIEVLKKLKEEDPDLIVVIITGYASVESAVEALKLGAYDYIKKPFKADVIKLIVKLALETQRLRKEVKAFRSHYKDILKGKPLIAESPSMQELLVKLKKVATLSDTTVLITGETGTGKDLFARTIHALSPRSERPFIEVNCAALPEQLLESELFGYERGAFTGARERKIGLFEAANGGTIFLDEIGELALGLQAKLLRVIEDKRIRRIGSTNYHDVEVRIIAATNRDLKRAVAEKNFREDLYFRLNAIPIHIPPLRERPEDIIALSKHFLAEYNKKYNRHFQGFSLEAKHLLLTYPWPGNVRELAHTIERICIMHDDRIVEKHHLPLEIAHGIDTLSDNSLSFPINIPPEGINLEEMIDRFTSVIIEKALAMVQGNISQAAKLLGIPRGTLRYKIEKYNISPIVPPPSKKP
ncbi:MAG: sigma-54 dependent transcriptional regulator [Syntrophobacterales bacterium]|nr:sigma-54 dependent transcriptional regulator [Syntrophobacterales bacterium]